MTIIIAGHAGTQVPVSVQNNPSTKATSVNNNNNDPNIIFQIFVRVCTLYMICTYVTCTRYMYSATGMVTISRLGHLHIVHIIYTLSS